MRYRKSSSNMGFYTLTDESPKLEKEELVTLCHEIESYLEENNADIPGELDRKLVMEPYMNATLPEGDNVEIAGLASLTKGSVEAGNYLTVEDFSPNYDLVITAEGEAERDVLEIAERVLGPERELEDKSCTEMTTYMLWLTEIAKPLTRHP